MRASVLLLLVASLVACEPADVPCTGDCEALSCGPGIDNPPFEGAQHVPEGTTVSYRANPPASGDHWPNWERTWGVFPMPLPRGRWLHNLEHGGVLLLYNCPGGCDDVVQRLVALRNGRRPDRYNAVRVIVTPDPLMPKRVAAVAWNWRWQGDDVDEATLNCFIDRRYDRAPESIP
jgi:hypothetical protein